MNSNHSILRVGVPLVVLLAALCVYLSLKCVEYKAKEKKAEATLNIVLVVQESLLKSDLDFLGTILDDSYNANHLRPALAQTYKAKAGILKAHVAFMKDIGMDVSSASECLDQYAQISKNLSEKHKHEKPADDREDVDSQRRIVLPE